MIELAAKSALAYLIGTIMGGTVIGWLRGGVDLRQLGSGNIGATNALRTQGKGFALAVLLLDAGKGVFAVLALPALNWPWAGAPALSRESLAYVCGVAVALGHIYPVWFRFRGGKGVATLTGVFGALMTTALPWMLVAFALTVLLTGYVGLASVFGALTAAIYVGFGPGLATPAGFFTLAMAGLVIFKHRDNLRRVFLGTEPRFERARVLGRWLDR